MKLPSLRDVLHLLCQAPEGTASPGRPPPSSGLVGTWTAQVMPMQAAQLSKTALFAVP